MQDPSGEVIQYAIQQLADSHLNLVDAYGVPLNYTRSGQSSESTGRILAQNGRYTLTSAHSDIPWQQIVGMRNHLIHVYFDIDYDTIWTTVQEDISALRKMIENLFHTNEGK